MSWDHPEIREAILRALAEDIGSGDATTEACIPDDARASGFFLTREPLVLAGTPLLPLIYTEEQLEILYVDGADLGTDVVFARVGGAARRLLAFERTTLNFIQ